MFPYLHDQLSKKFELYYVDGDSELVNLYGTYNFFVAPLVTAPEYSAFIKNIIDKYRIDFYIPLIDEELIRAKSELENYNGVKVMTPSVAFCELSLNKVKLMQVLHELEISTIISSSGDNFVWEGDAPVFVKPIYGRGSRGIKKIEDPDQLEAYYKLEKYEPSQIIIQDYIQGTEYTIGATVNNLNDLLAISVKRVIKKKGITQIAVLETNELLTKTVEKVVNLLKPHGPINIQLYLTADNKVKIFEINPRFSTTTIMSYAGGVDEIEMYVDFYDTHYTSVPVQPRDNIVLHRRWENVFYEK